MSIFLLTHWFQCISSISHHIFSICKTISTKPLHQRSSALAAFYINAWKISVGLFEMLCAIWYYLYHTISSVLVVNFEHISHIFLCFYCWFWTSKWLLEVLTHYMKSVQIRSYFWSVFSCIRTRNNSLFGHFSCNDCAILEIFHAILLLVFF